MKDLIKARAEIASLQEQNKNLSNLKREADILFEKEKVDFENYKEKSEFTVCSVISFRNIGVIYLIKYFFY